MNIEYVIEPALNHATITFDGLFQFAEFSLGYQSMLNDERFYPGINVIWDARNMDMSSVRLEEIMQLAEFLKPFTQRRGGGKSACVVNAGAQQSIARLFEKGAQASITTDFRIFISMADAQNWMSS